MQRIKLSKEQSKAIRNELPRGSYQVIAEAMDVDAEAVREVLRGRIFDNYGIIPAAHRLIEKRNQEVEKKVNKL